jgi:hypothetical protein
VALQTSPSGYAQLGGQSLILFPNLKTRFGTVAKSPTTRMWRHTTSVPGFQRSPVWASTRPQKDVQPNTPDTWHMKETLLSRVNRGQTSRRPVTCIGSWWWGQSWTQYNPSWGRIVPDSTLERLLWLKRWWLTSLAWVTLDVVGSKSGATRLFSMGLLGLR